MPDLAMVGDAACTWVLRIGPDNASDVAATAELGECKHGSGIGALVVFDLQFDAPSQHAAGIVDFFLREPDAVDREFTGLGLHAGNLVDDADS
jgi:hypothetical protein